MDRSGPVLSLAPSHGLVVVLVFNNRVKAVTKNNKLMFGVPSPTVHDAHCFKHNIEFSPQKKKTGYGTGLLARTRLFRLIDH